MNTDDSNEKGGPQEDSPSTGDHHAADNSVTDETEELHVLGESLPEPVRKLHAAGCSIIPVGADKKCILPGWKEFQGRKPTLKELETWTKYNPAGWAIVTGAISNRFVIDGDGPESLDTFKKWGLTPQVKTPSGGGHVHVTHPGWHVTTKSKLSDEYPNIDIRGDGGYAIFYGQTESGEYEII